MSDRAARLVGDVLRVLLVGESGPIDETAAALSASDEPVSVLRERTVADARQRLAEADVHCLVCAYDRSTPGSHLDRLSAASEVPIVAVADEAVADAALADGAADVVDPAAPERLIGTRIRNAAERYRLATETTDRRYRSVLEGTTALVCVVDESGAIDYVNTAVDERMGYTPAELERTTLFRLVHPDDRPTARETIADAAARSLGATETTTLRLGHADGSWRVSDLHVVNRLGDPTVDGLVVTVTDATPDGLVDEELATAIDHVDAAIFTVGPRWELRLCNDAARSLFTSAAEPSTDRDATDAGSEPDHGDGEPDEGRPGAPGEVDRSRAAKPESGTVIWDVLPDDLRDEFADRLREAAATDSAVEFETTAAPIDGRLAVTATPLEDGVSVFATPIPDDAAVAVDRDRLEQFEAIVEGLEDGIAVLDGSTVTYANQALFDLADGEALVGRDVASLVDDDLAAAIRDRARSPLVRWMDPLTGTLEIDGERRPVAVSVVPLALADRERTCCVFRDRHGSPAAAVSTLAETAVALRRADRRSAVRDAVVDAVRSYTGADVAIWYRLDDSVIRPSTVATSTGSADAEPPSIDRRDDPLSEVLDTDGAVVSDRDELEPFLSRSGIRADRVVTVPVGDAGLLLATSTDPTGFEGIDLDPVDALAGMAAIALDRLAADRRRRDLERDREALETTLDRASAVWDLERDLFEAESRSAVERRLASGLVSLGAVDAGSIELVWIGDAAVGSDVVSVRTWAGRDGSIVESLPVPVDPEADDPAGRTAATTAPTHVPEIEATDRSEWRQEALDRGFRAALSVPLVYDEFSYGTVTIYADRPSALDERTRAICEHLATVAGFAITAIDRKRALVSDSVTELEIAVDAGSGPLPSLARRLEARIDVRTVVPRSSGGTTVFCTIADGEESVVRDAVDETDGIESCRVVGDRTSGPFVELVCPGDTLAETLADHGAVLRSIAPVGTRPRLVIELPSTVDVRSFVGMLDRKVPGAELTARREGDPARRPDRSFEAELRERLSERQLRTLETAYYSGFFEWPRESTGEDVADSLGVSQPTFSRHFRLAQQKLFTLLFEDLDGSADEE